MGGRHFKWQHNCLHYSRRLTFRKHGGQKVSHAPRPSVDLDIFGVSKCACWTNCKYSRDVIVAPRRRCLGSFFVWRWQLLGSCYNSEPQRDIMARGQQRVFSSVSDLLGSESSGLQQVTGTQVIGRWLGGNRLHLTDWLSLYDDWAELD